MSEPFLGEIRIFGFQFAPKGWAFCQGQLLPINQNTALFSLLGTTYGGNGQTNFALPNATSRCFIGFNSQHPLGEMGGESTHSLSDQEIPNHIHSIAVSNTKATQKSPANNFFGLVSTDKPYDSQGVSTAGLVLLPNNGGQAHNNMMPTLSMNFCIAMQGIFPSRN